MDFGCSVTSLKVKASINRPFTLHALSFTSVIDLSHIKEPTWTVALLILCIPYQLWAFAYYQLDKTLGLVDTNAMGGTKFNFSSALYLI